MPETKRDKQFFTVARVFFLLIVIPLLLMSFLIANGIFQLGDTSRKRAVTVLDQKSQEEIKVRAINVADEVADFLREREKDILIATILPTTEAAYKEFVDKSRQPFWVKKDGKIIKVFERLYREMSLIDKTGNEVIKIIDGEIVPKAELLNISNPASTTYKSEEYFLRARQRGKGEIYMSPVTGWYVNRSDFEAGKRFSGIIRLATPLFDKKGFAGLVVFALDARHLAKFTDTIVPTEPGYVFEADASTGNYAFMVDNRGFVVSHPNDYHIAGLYKDGTPVPPLTEKTMESMTEKGEEVLNLNLLGPINPALSEAAKAAAEGKSGIQKYTFAGLRKIAAYAPIPFFSKSYPKPAGFGWIAMGVDVEKFNELATKESQKIEKEAKAWTATIILILIAAVVLLFLISAVLARGISRSIAAEVPEESLHPEHYDDEEED